LYKTAGCVHQENFFAVRWHKSGRVSFDKKNRIFDGKGSVRFDIVDIQGIEHELFVSNFRTHGIRSVGWNRRRDDVPGGQRIQAGNALNDF
jgi:hypothetical protein